MKRAASIAVFAIAFLWLVNLGLRTIALAIEPDDSSLSAWPSLGRVAIQAILFGALFTLFVEPTAKLRRSASFGALLGLFAWLPENLHHFTRILRFDWDLELSALAIGATLDVAGRWGLLGYLSGRLSRWLS
jgi:hypothetical protein